MKFAMFRRHRTLVVLVDREDPSWSRKRLVVVRPNILAVDTQLTSLFSHSPSSNWTGSPLKSHDYRLPSFSHPYQPFSRFVYLQSFHLTIFSWSCPSLYTRTGRTTAGLPARNSKRLLVTFGPGHLGMRRRVGWYGIFSASFPVILE